MKKLMVKTSILAILALFVLAACAYNKALVNTSYDILSVSKASYETAMSSARDLKEKGLLNEATIEKIWNAAEVFSASHNEGVALLAKYKESESLSDAELLENQLAMVSEAIKNLMDIVNPLIGGDK